MILRIFLSIIIPILLISCGGHGRPPIPETLVGVKSVSSNPHTLNVSKKPTRQASAELAKSGIIIKYQGYTVSYNEDARIPNWVSYELTSSETDGPYSRKGKNFRQDPSLTVRQADSDDYRNSGWSRGHMAPAGDFKWSNEAMWETFYYVNCCPQDQSLNAGQWNTLEQKVRDWARKFGAVHVITGPIMGENKNGSIGFNEVLIPDAFFKAILAGGQAIAFVMYNHNNNENIQKCAMCVDTLEALTGINFFAELEDDLERQIEATYNLRNWGL